MTPRYLSHQALKVVLHTCQGFILDGSSLRLCALACPEPMAVSMTMLPVLR